ncbi:magnesium transporter CorA family protein [Paenarthrobacter sp. Z7-10]|uniref:magnesium transporter CorA family protein n=1 Tax=Paenarthrobacter sp. Z7-10 TaxID=2787635 RepID=UPI0022A92B23|nr:magnesium transporter CorA family protein [Paenarthrobacter sp. Z7-10]MCZ2402434.1 magnesium transporter CorA family protein [Paenarthrobacter sp. Z7-10]
MLRIRVYRGGRRTGEEATVNQLGQLAKDPEATVWIDVSAPDEAVIGRLREQLGFHRLAVEDVLGERQRPKLEAYRDHFFLNAYVTSVDEESADPAGIRLHTTEVSAFITANVVVVVPDGPGFDAEEVLRRAEEAEEPAQCGSGFLVYALLDSLVDGQLAASEALDSRADDLGSLLFAHRPKDVQLESFRLHKELTTLRRVLVPMREVLSAVLRHETARQDGSEPLKSELVPYFQDVYDHVLRAVDWTESARDMVNNVLQTYLTIQGNNMNVIMKKVTSWAAIIAVPTAITGFYGMNVPYPGVGTQAGVGLAAILIVLVSVALYVIFKKRNWL